MRKGGQGLSSRLLLEETVNPFDSLELFKAGSHKGSEPSWAGRSPTQAWSSVSGQEFEWSVRVQGFL